VKGADGAPNPRDERGDATIVSLFEAGYVVEGR
jgi:hypothetical protein